MPFFRTLLALVVGVTALRAGELRTLKGEVVSGDLIKVDEKEVVLSKDGDRTATTVDKILQVDVGPTATIPRDAKYIEVELVDRSQLLCSALTIKGREVELTLLLTGQQLKLPLASIANVLTEAQSEKHRKDWADRLKKKHPRDILALVSNENVVNGLEGTLGEGDEEGKTIAFTQPNGRKREVPQERVHGMIFWRKVDPNLPPTLFKLTDSYHNLVVVSSVTTTETGLKVTTPAGAKLDYTFQQLAKLDYSHGKLTYLSDLMPTRLNKDDKDKEGIVFFEKDRTTFEGRFVPIRMKGITYPKGLFIQATTEVEYDLGGDYLEFKAIVGIDDYDTRGEDCPTMLVIEGDNQKLYTDIINPKEADKRVKPLTLNIKDVQKLKITVKSGGGFSTVARQITLADAKVTK